MPAPTDDLKVRVVEDLLERASGYVIDRMALRALSLMFSPARGETVEEPTIATPEEDLTAIRSALEGLASRVAGYQ